MKPAASEDNRLKLIVRGAVQGVGFRPFVHRLATRLSLAGWVNNSPQGVFIEVEGPSAALEQFLLRLEAERPPHSFIQSLESSWLDPVGYEGFEIRASESGGDQTALVLPDIATCPDCIREILDPANRRYRYPFTNCTHCGPRFSIITALPYDRGNTTMAGFEMCPACRAEYEDPANRRFHAQPNACPVCGPQLELWRGRVGESAEDRAVTTCSAAPERGFEALLAVADAIRAGQIVAIKGIGGFHLMVDARNETAVRRLRERKHREEKPLALMFPSLDAVREQCALSALEQRLLRSPEAPIVLLARTASGRRPILRLPEAVAPGNPFLGVMLPYSPLHHLLLAELDFPVVATSGNLSDEPICTDEHEALDRLGGIADLFLVHNRPIVRHVDDSILRVVAGRELVLRRARGYAPLPVPLPVGLLATRHPPILAVGAHLKNTVALCVQGQVFASQHIGDLETEAALQAFRRVVADLPSLFQAPPTEIACDLHPDYVSTREARASGLPVVSVQHHYAHVLSAMAENELQPPVLGVSWDGTGYGPDATVWGGEFLVVDDTSFRRVAHLRTFRLPGGEAAVKEPRRSALGLAFEVFGEGVFDEPALPFRNVFAPAERDPLLTMLRRGVNSPVTSSAGRLFDAVASLVGLRQISRFEGQAAMELEFALEGIVTDDHYPAAIREPAATSGVEGKEGCGVLDWEPMIRALLSDATRGAPPGFLAAKFHNTLVEWIVAIAARVDLERAVLTGGCFQNRCLLERAIARLTRAGRRPYWHQRVPPNDGGIALGQVLGALRARGTRSD